jgi:hypothetical protein
VGPSSCGVVGGDWVGWSVCLDAELLHTPHCPTATPPSSPSLASRRPLITLPPLATLVGPSPTPQVAKALAQIFYWYTEVRAVNPYLLFRAAHACMIGHGQ